MAFLMRFCKQREIQRELEGLRRVVAAVRFLCQSDTVSFLLQESNKAFSRKLRKQREIQQPEARGVVGAEEDVQEELQEDMHRYQPKPQCLKLPRRNVGADPVAYWLSRILRHDLAVHICGYLVAEEEDQGTNQPIAIPDPGVNLPIIAPTGSGFMFEEIEDVWFT